MKCPLKPGITCAATASEVDGTPCPGCTAGRARTRSAAPGDLPLNAPLDALRRQLRERLAEAEKVSKNRPKVKTSSKDLVKGKSKHFFEASGSEQSKHFGVKSGVKPLYFAGVVE